MARRTLIYGGSGGIGAAIARMLRARGEDLHLVARNNEKLAAIGAELRAATTAGDVQEGNLFDRVAGDVGESLDGFVYAVGTINLRNLERLHEQDFLRDFQVNAMGAALALRAVLPALKRSKESPSVVLFSSIAALQGFAMHASMGMAKGAVAGLTLSLAAELAPQIRVNAIAPSLTRTPLAEKILSSDQLAKSIAQLHPLPRLGTPEDIAALAAFLLSSGAGWITGQIISVDGGRSTLRVKG